MARKTVFAIAGAMLLLTSACAHAAAPSASEAARLATIMHTFPLAS